MDLREQARALWQASRNWPWWNRWEQEAFLRRARRLARKVDPERDEPDHRVATMVLDNLETRLGRRVWPAM